MPVETPTADPQTSVLSRLVRPGDPDLAHYFLEFDFTDEERRRAAELAEHADLGTLTPAEQRELDGFARMNNILGTLKSKARQALGRPAPHVD